MNIPPLRQFKKQDLSKKLSKLPWRAQGRICDVVGGVIEASLPASRLGTVTEIEVHKSDTPVLAEIVGFRKDKTLLLPYSGLNGVRSGAVVREQSFLSHIPVGNYLLGTVLDPFLKRLSEAEVQVPQNPHYVPLEKEAPNPMLRKRIAKVLGLGIRAIDGLLSFGEGQRLGIMAGSGVGKSVLMGMIARGSECDINVIGLIGERGREVREFIEKELGDSGLRKSVVIVATGDQSPLMRVRAAKAVFSVAEYFSSQGRSVLLMMDSLTRVAQAQREIGLSVGEAPTSKGYTPSVFSLLPRLLERSGPQEEGKGPISGLYTVLVDSDDFSDPLVDAARAILDGHIQLSRTLASQGHFPAIDVSKSVSRVMHDVVSPEHLRLALEIKGLLAVWEENLDFIQMGTYQEGVNPHLDQAVRVVPHIKNFLKQPMNQLSGMDEAIAGMVQIIQFLKTSADQGGMV